MPWEQGLADEPWFSGVFASRLERHEGLSGIWVSAAPHIDWGQTGIRRAPRGEQASRANEENTRGKNRKKRRGKAPCPLHFQFPPNINQLPCTVLPFALTSVLPP